MKSLIAFLAIVAIFSSSLLSAAPALAHQPEKPARVIIRCIDPKSCAETASVFVPPAPPSPPPAPPIVPTPENNPPDYTVPIIIGSVLVAAAVAAVAVAIVVSNKGNGEPAAERGPDTVVDVVLRNPPPPQPAPGGS